MGNESKYAHLKTDKERYRAIDKMPCTDWGVVADWEKETTDPEYKKLFHSAARSMYHTEEYYNGTL